MKNSATLVPALLTFVLALGVEHGALAQFARPGASFAPLDAVSGNRTARAVALDGDRALVGATGDSTLSPASGAGYIFELQANGEWIEVAKLIPASARSLHNAGHSVALDGDRAVLSSRTFGYATIFERQVGGNWLEITTVTAPVANASEFGNSVALEGDRLVVASTNGNPFAPAHGQLFVFERNGAGAWPHVATATPSAPLANGIEVFGTALELQGDRAAIGAPTSDIAGSDAGAIYVFERQTGGGWIEVAVLTAATPAAIERLGDGVGLDGDLLVGGGSGNAQVGFGVGAAHVFERQVGGNWLETDVLFPTGASVADGFGTCVDLEGGWLVVGAAGSDIEVANAGAAYVYQLESSGSFVERAVVVHEDAAAFDALGSFVTRSIEIDSGRALLGTPGSDAFAGRAHVLTLGPLFHGATKLSIATADSQDFMLRAGSSSAGRLYLILGSVSGTAPAIPIAPGVDLPLVYDAYTDLGLALATPVFPAVGLLDPSGAADASFAIPPGTNPSFAGLVIDHAFVTIDLATYAIGASNAARLEIVL